MQLLDGRFFRHKSTRKSRQRSHGFGSRAPHLVTILIGTNGASG